MTGIISVDKQTWIICIFRINYRTGMALLQSLVAVTGEIGSGVKVLESIRLPELQYSVLYFFCQPEYPEVP